MENTKAEFYESPEARVVEIKVRGAILAGSSPNGTDSYDRETW